MGSSFYNRQDFDRRLYFVRQRAENAIEFSDLPEAAREHVLHLRLSANRIVYKGMLTADAVARNITPICRAGFRIGAGDGPLAIQHQHFPMLAIAPIRIATRPQRRNQYPARQPQLDAGPLWLAAVRRLWRRTAEDVSDPRPRSGSDSATLDNALQFLALNGRSLPHSVLMLIPEAWQNNDQMDPDLKAFYEYHACLMEPWDGPAQHRVHQRRPVIGAVLDRNGLRPSRYYVTKDDLVIMASEVGVLPVEPERCRPQMAACSRARFSSSI